MGDPDQPTFELSGGRHAAETEDVGGPNRTPRLGGLLDDRFEVRGELGHGGMGVVYRAYDRQAQREVAVKVMASAALSREQLERFCREGEITARLRHPGIVRVHSAGEIDGIPYLAYQLVEGEELDLERHPLRRRTRPH